MFQSHYLLIISLYVSEYRGSFSQQKNYPPDETQCNIALRW